MQAYKIFSIGGVCLCVAGCMAPVFPQSPGEFRTLVTSDSQRGTAEVVNSSRSFSEVVSTFKKMAPQCLSMQITTNAVENGAHRTIVERYRPTVTANAKKLELDVKLQMTMNNKPAFDHPNGWYILVVDVTPTGDGKAKAVFYRPASGYTALIKGVKGWVAGESTGCPDLSSPL